VRGIHWGVRERVTDIVRGIHWGVRERVIPTEFTREDYSTVMTDTSKYVQPAIPKFDGHYDHWAKLMENFLGSKEFWHLVENGIADVSNKADASEEEIRLMEEQKLKDWKIKNYLYMLMI